MTVSYTGTATTIGFVSSLTFIEIPGDALQEKEKKSTYIEGEEKRGGVLSCGVEEVEEAGGEGGGARIER